jgi:hypothetical protein
MKAARRIARNDLIRSSKMNFGNLILFAGMIKGNDHAKMPG